MGKEPEEKSAFFVSFELMGCCQNVQGKVLIKAAVGNTDTYTDRSSDAWPWLDFEFF